MKYSVKDASARAHNIYESDNQVVTHLNLKSGESIPSHDSNMSVVVVIYEGQVIFTEKDKEYTIKSGDIIKLEPEVSHSLKALDDSKLMVIKSDLK
ncbi:cupin domain-containing protein [Anaerococcus sp. mt242]|uniref:cupin domain-containing protein n=1 Tax=unclassified Anaerococcus TaxID=2614126 RepID=UPI0019327470|nr:cupin domain-containing protein [Anaerococcus sp. mt242]MBM0046401.1 AraC family ligand binding domain-containing protein [Anaerococcus sp. mt242]